MPRTFDFCIPTRSTSVPATPDWLHEVKYDGYRLRLERDGDRVRLITKGGYNWTELVARLFKGLSGYFCRGCVGNPPYESQLRNEKARTYLKAYRLALATWRLEAGRTSNS